MAHRPQFPRICIALGFEDADRLLRCAGEEADDGGTFFEFRLDYLKEPQQGAATIAGFLEDYPSCQVLATCRRAANRGGFQGEVEEQVRLLEAAAEAGARAVDLEIESAEPAKRSLEPLREKAELIVSYHNFTGTPALDPVLRRLRRIPATAYKIAVTARKPSDIERLFRLCRSNPRVPLIVLSMGEVGFPSRVIAPTFNVLHTYAAPGCGKGTAAGQIAARQLRHQYRLEKLTRKTKIYGVIADPVAHSISPAVHNRAFQHRRIDAVYCPFLVRAPHLRDFFALARQLPVAGFSVTIPHKQKVLRYLDIVDPLARRIGAVNTVWRKAGKWRGANTDAAGVTAPLARLIRVPKSSILLIGNGGAARAAAFALTDKGARVSITGRNAERVAKLARASGAEAVRVGQLADLYFDAVVNATPIGMHPNVDDCFFPGAIPADVVFDMVYNPLETTLLRRAREQRKETIAGIQMFIEQATHQFETWTGLSAPRAAMERAAREALNAQAAPIIRK